MSGNKKKPPEPEPEEDYELEDMPDADLGPDQPSSEELRHRARDWHYQKRSLPETKKP